MKKCLLSPLLLILQFWDLITTYGKSCILHILVGFNLIFDSSFKVKRVVDTSSALYLFDYWSYRIGM